MRDASSRSLSYTSDRWGAHLKPTYYCMSTVNVNPKQLKTKKRHAYGVLRTDTIQNKTELLESRSHCEDELRQGK